MCACPRVSLCVPLVVVMHFIFIFIEFTPNKKRQIFFLLAIAHSKYTHFSEDGGTGKGEVRLNNKRKHSTGWQPVRRDLSLVLPLLFSLCMGCEIYWTDWTSKNLKRINIAIMRNCFLSFSSSFSHLDGAVAIVGIEVVLCQVEYFPFYIVPIRIFSVVEYIKWLCM